MKSLIWNVNWLAKQGQIKCTSGTSRSSYLRPSTLINTRIFHSELDLHVAQRGDFILSFKCRPPRPRPEKYAALAWNMRPKQAPVPAMQNYANARCGLWGSGRQAPARGAAAFYATKFAKCQRVCRVERGRRVLTLARMQLTARQPWQHTHTHTHILTYIYTRPGW